MGNGLLQKLKWLFILWLARRLPDCKQMTMRLGESLDRSASLRDRIMMRLHLFTCEACERYIEQVEFLKNALHVHGDREPVSPEFERARLPEDSKRRIKAILRLNTAL